jgi:nitrate/TMAO reductase-like tetraheme cytochrome c subunit
MRRLFSAIKRFFLPPPGRPVWVRLLPFAFLGLLTIFTISGTVYGWTYTNSPEFCGSACHTMPPQYSAYLQSPHARVQCVECHIGRDVVTTQFTRKAGDLRHVVLTITQDYEFPIRSRAMRPARDSCERCHFPEKFSDDSLREIQHFANDEASTAEIIYLILKTGGGTEREGLGQGIHWHIQNEVRYLATDSLEQEIPYVRVVGDDGVITEFYDVASGFTPDNIAGTELQTMDCITCHNRITHSIPSPEEAIDQAISKDLIAGDLPFIRQKTVELLSQPYPDQQAGFAALTTLPAFYQENYPEIYAERQVEIEAVVGVMHEIYSLIVFPEQKIDWQTHPDNLGHTDSPGCFRCHDGKHMTSTGEAIRLECNLCHSVPVTAESRDLVANLEIVRGPEPTSHTHTSWITLHGQAIDASCAACHEPPDPGLDYSQLEGPPPVSDSFCGNSACHANEWVYSGFDSPELEPILARQLYILQNTSPYLLDDAPHTYATVFKTMFEGRCLFCHAGAEARAGLDLSSYESMLAGGDGGPALVPGDPAASLILQRQSQSRPHFGQMLDDEIEALTAWIAAGAPRE